MTRADQTSVRVEITAETLTRLLANGQVCAADFRCLDCKSKQCLWRICLKSCTGKVTVNMKEKATPMDFCRACSRFLKDCSKETAKDQRVKET